jgi:hypothetical protein
MPTFLAGIELNRRFYREVVRPLLDESFPSLPYAAALLGPGSEVLGFDTAMSMDHDWGLRLLVVPRAADAAVIDALEHLLHQRLPSQFLGYPIYGAAQQAQPASGRLDRSVILSTLRDFTRERFGGVFEQPLHVLDWLTIPAQALREVTDGAVYHDGTGELTALRASLAWYPHDVWLYLLASGWQRIGQEEHLMPRAGFVGDELGSALIGSRLIHDIMHLCFLMERRYPPYPKWFGTAFRQLNCAASLEPALWRAQRAATWQEREAALALAYESLARMHNALGITEPMPETVSNFYDRPFRVIHGEACATAIAAHITDPEVKRIAALRLIGNIDQITDNTDVRGRGNPRLRHLYEE